MKNYLYISLILILVLSISCNRKQKQIDIWNSRIEEAVKNKKHVIKPGVGTNTYFVGKTPIKSVLKIIGDYDDFTQGITDYFNREATFANRYIYEKRGLTFITNTDESKGQDIENAIIDTIKFNKNSKAQTVNGLSIGDEASKIHYIFGKQEDRKTQYKNVTYYYFNKTGITIIVDNSSKKIEEFVIYKPYG